MRFRPLELKLNFRLRQSGEQNEKQMTDNRQTTGGEEKEPYSSMEIVKRMLREHNILLSACSAKKGLHGGKYLRIAIRGHQDKVCLCRHHVDKRNLT